MDILRARKSWTGILQTERDHKCQPRLLYLLKISIPIAEINKTILKQYLTIYPEPQKVLQGKPIPEDVKHTQKNTTNK